MALINSPPFREDLLSNGRLSLGWTNWLMQVFRGVLAIYESGTTAQRPTTGLWVGRPYFDTTLVIPIWYDGSGWIDATGAAA